VPAAHIASLRIVPDVDGRAAVLGEFGGLGLPVPGHTWVEKTWGYRGTANAAELTQQYSKLLQRAYQLKDDPGLNAVLYTQTTDCETECNGLITYDREVVKPDLRKTAAQKDDTFTLRGRTLERRDADVIIASHRAGGRHALRYGGAVTAERKTMLPRWSHPAVVAGWLAVLTLAVFRPVAHFDFLHYDDINYVTA